MLNLVWSMRTMHGAPDRIISTIRPRVTPNSANRRAEAPESCKPVTNPRSPVRIERSVTKPVVWCFRPQTVSIAMVSCLTFISYAFRSALFVVVRPGSYSG